MPQLRGIARTAPYFHDNSRETLRDVVDEAMTTLTRDRVGEDQGETNGAIHPTNGNVPERRR